MKNQKGISLLETLMAMFLTILIVVFTFEVYPSIAKSLHILENHTYAASLANSVINDAKSTGFDNIVTSSGSKKISGTRNGLPYSEEFNYTLNVQNADANKKVVWAEVTWNEAGKTKKVTIETIVVKS